MFSPGALSLRTVVSALLLVASPLGCVAADKQQVDSATGTGTSTSSASGTDGTAGASDTGTTGVSASGTGTGDTGLPTTGAPGTTGDTGTTQASTTTAVDTTTGGTTDPGTTTGSSSGEGSTTGEPPSIEGACEAACMVFLECVPEAYPDLPSCSADCLAGAVGDGECEAAAIVFNTCIGGYNCGELTMALEVMEFGECTAAYMAYTAHCTP